MRNGYGFTEVDMNMGFIDLDLLSPDQRGEGGEDDPADTDVDDLPEGTHCVWEFHCSTVPQEDTLDTWGESMPRVVRTSRTLGDGVWRQSDGLRVAADMGRRSGSRNKKKNRRH